MILPEIVSEEPLTPVVPHGDEVWFDIVKNVMAGLIYAEAYGIDSTNVDEMAAGDNVKAKRLLGSEGDFGQESLGLEKTFMQDVVEQVGNYGEIYERNLGAPRHRFTSQRSQRSLDKWRSNIRGAITVI